MTNNENVKQVPATAETMPQMQPAAVALTSAELIVRAIMPADDSAAAAILESETAYAETKTKLNGLITSYNKAVTALCEYVSLQAVAKTPDSATVYNDKITSCTAVCDGLRTEIEKTAQTAKENAIVSMKRKIRGAVVPMVAYCTFYKVIYVSANVPVLTPEKWAAGADKCFASTSETKYCILRPHYCEETERKGAKQTVRANLYSGDFGGDIDIAECFARWITDNESLALRGMNTVKMPAALCEKIGYDCGENGKNAPGYWRDLSNKKQVLILELIVNALIGEKVWSREWVGVENAAYESDFGTKSAITKADLVFLANKIGADKKLDPNTVRLATPESVFVTLCGIACRVVTGRKYEVLDSAGREYKIAEKPVMLKSAETTPAPTPDSTPAPTPDSTPETVPETAA